MTTTTCSPEKPCSHCHPEFAGKRCRIEHVEAGVINIHGSSDSGELRIEWVDDVPTINGVRVPSPDVLTEMAGILRAFATQRAGLVLRDECCTKTQADFPNGCQVWDADGREGVVTPSERFGWVCRTNAHNSVQVRVAYHDGSTGWRDPATLRRVDA